MRGLKIFSGRANVPLARKIAQSLALPLGHVSLGTFPDGENYCKIEDVRGHDVFLVQPTSPQVNDNLMELLIMIDTCKRASAARVTAVMPYYGYARQDRKDEGRVPITAKLVANLITRAGADRVLTMDLHAAQIQGFFDVPVDHLYASTVIDRHFQQMKIDPDDLCIVSPDAGSIKRTQSHLKRLGGTLAIVDKVRRSSTEITSQNIIGGPVEGKIAIIIDDMISTAGSIVNAASVIHAHGAREVHVAATHGILCGRAIERLLAAPVASIVVTDTVHVSEDKWKKCGDRLVQLTVSEMFGGAISRIHHDQSVSALFEEVGATT